jgi:hypothetical protein
MKGARTGRSAAATRGEAAILALALLFVSGGAAAAPLKAAAAPRRAVLLRGADAVKGLPFFSPNAIAALSGLYALEKAGAQAEGGAPAQVAVWYSRESIVFAAAWKRVDPRGVSSYADAAYSLARGSGSILAMRSEGYALFFELSDDPRALAFARAFSAKFPIFFHNASSDTELSFPAYVDY